MILAANGASSEVLSLDEAVRAGLNNHERIKSNEIMEKKSEFDLKKARADRLFTIFGDYSYTRLQDAPVMKQGGVSIPTGEQDNYSWGVRLVQPVFSGFEFESKENIACVDVERAKLTTERSRLDIAWRVKRGYNDLYLSGKTLRVAELTVRSLKAYKKDAVTFYGSGLVPYNDLLKAEVALAEAVQKEQQDIANLKLARSALNVLIGKKSTDELEIEPLADPMDCFKTMDELKSTSMTQRPEIKLIEASIESLGYLKKIRQASCYPNVCLVAGYEQNGEDYRAEENDHVRSHNASISIQANWILFDFKKRRSAINSVEYQRRSEREILQDLKESIALEVERAFRNLRVAENNIETAGKGVVQAKENWRITTVQYKEQSTTSTEVLNSRTDLTAAETGYFRALHNYWSAMADLERSIGKVL